MLLFSLILPSCMAAPKIELANTFYFTQYSAVSFSIGHNCVFEDINMNIPRDRSNLSSPNSFRKSSTHLAMPSISYVDRIEVQNLCSSWNE